LIEVGKGGWWWELVCEDELLMIVLVGNNEWTDRRVKGT
jgi:hypothetical protein